MPRQRKYASDSERAQAHRLANFERLTLDLRKDAQISKSVLQKAAAALGLSVAALLMNGALKYIHDELGAEWLDKNENKDK